MQPGALGGAEIAAAPRVTVERTCQAEDSEGEEGREREDSGSDAAAEDPSPAKKDERRRSAQETFEMPLLVGRNLQVAQNLLQARGSYLLTQTDGSGQDRFQMVDYNWKVCAQDPAAGAVVDIATLVELVTVKSSETC